MANRLTCLFLPLVSGLTIEGKLLDGARKNNAEVAERGD